MSLTILVIADLLIGALLYQVITWLHPQVHVIFPQAIMSQLLPFWGELVFFSAYWVTVFGLSGMYRQVGRKGIGRYTTMHLSVSFIGVMLFTFFFFVKNDFLFEYGFFHFFFELTFAIVVMFWLPKAIHHLVVWYMMKHGKLAVHALLIGNTAKAEHVYTELLAFSGWIRYFFIGFVETGERDRTSFGGKLECVGSLDNLPEIINSLELDEIVVAIDSHDFRKIELVLAITRQKNLTVRLLPDMNAILEGTVRTEDIKGLPLITVHGRLMPVWQNLMKWVFDKLVSIVALLLFLPFLPFVALAVRLGSPGPVFYSQVRVGKGREPFRILKIRSMYIDAENGGPALSSDNDPRITPFGKFMRKWHIDEIPQFLNVLKGDMSIVGPRPEREFFIGQLVKIAPHYSHLFSVKPGITSWGMVKFGYAENIDQMVERLRYDILYLENVSFWVDIKIIAYTVKAVFTGKGK
ncbi:MAG: sugar transferase [Breznakibacter sp.]